MTIVRMIETSNNESEDNTMEEMTQTLSANRAVQYQAVPQGTMILGENQYYSKNCYETQLNNNVIVVGTSGAGKTRKIVKPNLLQAEGSYIVSDPKGNLAREMGPYLESKGYRVLKMNFIHPEKSLKYNPVAYCHTTTDVRKLAHMITYEMSCSTGGARGSAYDPFWDEAAEMLLIAIIGYIVECDDIPENEKNMNKLSQLIRKANRDEKFSTARGCSELDRIMDSYRKKMELVGRESWAMDRFDDYNTAPDRTHATINICTLAKLGTFDTLETRQMLNGNDIDFKTIGQEPTAVFVEVSDTDRSMDVLINLFYSQIMNELCTFADEECPNSCLPVPVQFILDDFATNARIDNFQNIIANIRSRGISAMIMLQSEAQLKAGYGEDAQTIIDNCNTYVYMGGSSEELAEKIGKRADKPAKRILNMPLSKSWIFRRGQEPVYCNNFDLEWFEREKGFEPGRRTKKSVQADIELV
ncbi:MAG: type IV secretory system conjugative DNA transfer family protein [Lachnospiraceae bacterium]|nr:type IV secretory system conjugative DNA transfer family protein [Lachnospiraceae bacterium]